MKNDIQSNPELRQRWEVLALPSYEANQEAFREFLDAGGRQKKVLNCAVTRPRAETLVQGQMPAGWDLRKCLQSNLAQNPELKQWDYANPIIRPQTHLPYFKLKDNALITKSPWTQYPNVAEGPAFNARFMHQHYPLWNELRPKTLRGVFTTLVLVSPQIGFSLTPHIQVDPMFRYFAALSRLGGPCQMMPAGYLYPDANIRGMENIPASMFADILPHVGGDAFPVMESTPNPWGELAHYHNRNYYYGYPVNAVANSQEDITLTNCIKGGTILPSGRSVCATNSENYIYATGNDELRQDLLLDREQFACKHALVRGTVTHDGIPFQIPPEMQACVFAITVTSWQLEMKRAGDLSEYHLRTQHAAIRSYHFYQQMEPYYSNFMRIIDELGRDASFETYLLSNHLTNSWLGGNLVKPTFLQTYAEKERGLQFVRSYYRQQLDWMMGVINLWNLVSFRKGKTSQAPIISAEELERQLPVEGVALHQLRQFLHCNSYMFNRIKRFAPFPDLAPGWNLFDAKQKADQLPMPAYEN